MGEMNYWEFLESKRQSLKRSGFDIKDSELNKHLFDFQKLSVTESLKAGKYSLFLDTGLGKTICQLEWGYQILRKENKPVLFLAPLAVSGQTINEGRKFGIEINKLNGQINKGLYITNYEQLDNIDTSKFIGIVLDESSILKNFEGKRKNQIIHAFKNTKYKLACTAMPSPNDIMEIANHTEFLNIMKRSEVLSKYFVHDGGQTQKWRLKGHAIKPFYDFVKQWAIMAEKPSDLGFDDDGFILPKLNIIPIQIETDKKDNGMLFNDVPVNATDFNKELRRTEKQRLNAVLDIVSKSNESWIIWTKQNHEAEYLNKNLPGSFNVRGSDSVEWKESKLLGFANNKFKRLITKAKIAQFGLNFQNCHNQIFASFDFSFESLYQAIRRSYRFGQKKEVNVYLIQTDSMSNIIQAINAKQNQFNTLRNYMKYEK